MRIVALYATDTMADWEYGHLLGGLAMSAGSDPDRYRLRIVTADPVDEVVTMGQVRLRPDGTVGDLDPDDVAALILPGAQTWDRAHDDALGLAATLLDRDVTVAAICGATAGLARVGLLDDRRHTSNAPEFLASVDGYAGAHLYVEAPAVRDGALVTAPASAPVAFARAVFESLELFPRNIIDAWYGLNTTGERRYRDVLVGADGPVEAR